MAVYGGAGWRSGASSAATPSIQGDMIRFHPPTITHHPINDSLIGMNCHPLGRMNLNDDV
jgi:hypothetical protein